MEDQLRSIVDRAHEAARTASDVAALAAVESSFLGKKGELTLLLRGLGALPKEERPAFGKLVNEAKVRLEELLADRSRDLESVALEAALGGDGFDPTEPGLEVSHGSLHPITQITRELVRVFEGLGFAAARGPEVEFEHFNFDALNIPASHPARDTQDTFWLSDGNLLRTHTSPVQVRAMERFGAPLRVIAPGRCFRNEAVDATHEHTFYQMEGLMIDRDISVANLIHVMKTCLREILGREVRIRLRPGFFPFVEPGFELDVHDPFGTGEDRWLELLPCGMVHPNVLRAGGLDPEEWTGFAFGLGLQRLVMIRYGITDIRDFTGGDLRFLEQFGRV
ncbi:MAG: phenylalanine--tRNA ligase subunit alpha [Planctomycetes bacterium]|nr:phenylalanine--tRNA ligase subunit alpha [Planctomycetota bacterium]